MKSQVVAVALMWALGEGSQGPNADADLCAVPPGAQPALPARLLPGMGVTDMPVTTVEGWAATAAALGDAGVAERAYREALMREPDSGRAYFGVAAALRAQHRTEEAQKMESKGREAWTKADPHLPQLRVVTDSSHAGRR